MIKVHSVLVRSKYDSNIGSSARAMANLSRGSLFLINPQCEIGSAAHRGAAGAQKTLNDMKVYASWEEFSKENKGPKIALSRRKGKRRRSYPLSLAAKIMGRSGQFQDLYLIFGPEASGLDTDDLRHCHISAFLPDTGEFQSFNLSQAVLLSHYIFSQNYPHMNESHYNEPHPEFPEEVLESWLLTMGFQLDSHRVNAYDTLLKMLKRSMPNEKEVSILKKALFQSIEIMKSYEGTEGP